MCDMGFNRKHWRLAVEESQYGADTVFWAYVRTLANIIEFKYLGRMITSTNDGCQVVVENTGKYKKKWAWLSQILGCEGAYAQVTGYI